MKYLPMFMKLTGRDCLVVGGGEVAARKVASLLRAEARVTVLAPDVNATLAALVEDGRIAHRRKCFAPDDVADFRLVVSATNRREVNETVHATCEQRNIPVNVVDCPEFCSFIFPALVDRSPVVIAISTGGASPVLARLVRTRLERVLPPAYGRLAELAERFRLKVKATLRQPDHRRRFWERTLDGPVADLVFAGREAEAEQRLDQLLEAERHGGSSEGGFVSLVGAGPGDPDLLTIGALRAMQEADVVVYDRLVSPEVMALVRNDAERIYVGKERSHHTLPQDEVNRLLIRLAREGRRVVRLKGGDPFIFGRGGEEIETLLEEGIPFRVIPGITAASGCAAYAGIPLTHRDYAQSVTFVTGHLKDGEIADLDWDRLTRPGQTLVIYMGVHGLARICQSLMAHGSAAATPAALVQRGTTPQQRLVLGTLADLPEQAESQGIASPALVIVGDVVRLQAKLDWFRAEPAPAPLRPDNAARHRHSG